MRGIQLARAGAIAASASSGVVVEAEAALVATGDVTAALQRQVLATATYGGVAVLTGAMERQVPAEATLGGVAAVTASASTFAQFYATATLDGGAGLAADGTVVVTQFYATATLDGVGGQTAAGALGASASATLAAAGAVTASASVETPVAPVGTAASDLGPLSSAGLVVHESPEGPPAPMSLVGSVNRSGPGSLTIPAATQEGDVVLLFVSSDNQSPSSVSNPIGMWLKAEEWLQLYSVDFASSDWAQCFMRVATASDAGSSFAVVGTSNFVTSTVVVLRGIGLPRTFVMGTLASNVTPSVAVTEKERLLVVFHGYANFNTNSISAPAGFDFTLNSWISEEGIFLAARTVPATGSESHTFTDSNSSANHRAFVIPCAEKWIKPKPDIGAAQVDVLGGASTSDVGAAQVDVLGRSTAPDVGAAQVDVLVRV